MRGFLISHKLDIAATQNEKFEFVINIAAGKIKHAEIVDRLSMPTTPQKNIS